MLDRSRDWESTPPGFSAITGSAGRRMIVRDELKEFFAAKVFSSLDSAGEPSSFSGRSQIRSIRLPNGRRALIRSYRHGGLLRAATGSVFFSRPPRPFRELLLTEEAKRRGVLTIVSCGACIEPLYAGFYKGWFVSEELEGARDLWAVASDRRGDFGSSEEIWVAVGRSLREMHRKGVRHNDLNLKNILLRSEAAALESYIIDLDQARLFESAVPKADAEQNLARLLRSIRKLDPKRQHICDKDWNALVDSYHGSYR